MLVWIGNKCVYEHVHEHVVTVVVWSMDRPMTVGEISMVTCILGDSV